MEPENSRPELDRFVCLVVSALERFERPLTLLQIRNHIQYNYPEEKIVKDAKMGMKLLVQHVLSQAETTNVVQRVHPSRYNLPPDVDPSRFPLPPKWRPRLVKKKRKKAKKKEKPKKKSTTHVWKKAVHIWEITCTEAFLGLRPNTRILLKNLVKNALKSGKKRKILSVEALFDFTVKEAKKKNYVAAWDCDVVRTMLELGVVQVVLEESGNGYCLKGHIRNWLKKRAATKTDALYLKNEDELEEKWATVLPKLIPAHLIPAVVSALRVLNNPDGSTKYDIVGHLRQVYPLPSFKSAMGIALKDVIGVAVNEVVTTGAAEKIIPPRGFGGKNSGHRFKLREDSDLSLFQVESTVLPALRCENDEVGSSSSRNMVIVDHNGQVNNSEEERKAGFKVRCGQLVDLVSLAMKDVAVPDGCSAKAVLQSVVAQHAEISSGKCPWEMRHIGKVLKSGKMLGIYDEQGKNFSLAKAVGDYEASEGPAIICLMEVDIKRRMSIVAVEERDGSPEIPEPRCSRVTRSQMAAPAAGTPSPDFSTDSIVMEGTTGAPSADV